MLLIQKEKSSNGCKFSGVGRTDGDLSVIGGYQKTIGGLPWGPGSGHTRCRPFAEKVRAMKLAIRNNEVLA